MSLNKDEGEKEGRGRERIKKEGRKNEMGQNIRKASEMMTFTNLIFNVYQLL